MTFCKQGMVLLACSFFTLVSSCKKSTASINDKIATYLDHIQDDKFSGVILVAKNNKILEQRAFGYASIENKVKNEIDTRFNIASITKMFTAVATLQLYEKGKISLHEPIGTYLPNYPNAVVRDSVTIHHLLTHTSGLGNFYVEKYLTSEKLQYQNVVDFLPLFVNDTVLFKPGSQYHYGASGFIVLGLVIEKVSGQNYYDYVRKEIFDPAHMKNTITAAIDSIIIKKARGYTSFFGESKDLKHNDTYLSKTSPGGFHYSTVEDLFNFSKALYDHQLLNKETLELMTSPKVKGYSTHLGYGIDIDQNYGQFIQGHSGGWYGVRGELMHFIDNDFTVVILSNIDDDGKSGTSKIGQDFKEMIANVK